MKMLQNTVVATILAVGLQAHVFAADEVVEDEAMFASLDDFFNDFEKLSEQSAKLSDKTVKSTHDALSKDANALLKEVREESQQIHKAAMQGMKSLGQGAVEVSRGLEESYAAMKKSQENLSKSIASIGAKVAQSRHISQFSSSEFENENHAKWGLKITLPSFTEKNLSVNIKKDDDGRKTLEITAKKENLPQKAEGKKTTGTVVVSTSCSRNMMTAVNGSRKQERVIYKDGVLTITRDLPSFIDETKYEMKFANEVLMIEFDKKTASSTTKLNFANK